MKSFFIKLLCLISVTASAQLQMWDAWQDPGVNPPGIGPQVILQAWGVWVPTNFAPTNVLATSGWTNLWNQAWHVSTNSPVTPQSSVFESLYQTYIGQGNANSNSWQSNYIAMATTNGLFTNTVGQQVIVQIDGTNFDLSTFGVEIINSNQDTLNYSGVYTFWQSNSAAAHIPFTNADMATYVIYDTPNSIVNNNEFNDNGIYNNTAQFAISAWYIPYNGVNQAILIDHNNNNGATDNQGVFANFKAGNPTYLVNRLGGFLQQSVFAYNPVTKAFLATTNTVRSGSIGAPIAFTRTGDMQDGGNVGKPTHIRMIILAQPGNLGL